MIVAFSLLSVGYLGLGILPTLLEAAGLVEYGKATRFTGLPDSDSRWMIVPVLFVIMVGGSFIKSIISASVAKETTEVNRARGYSIFIMMVNIGAFTGKTVIDPLRNVIGDQAYIYINYFSATMTILALLSVIQLGDKSEDLLLYVMGSIYRFLSDKSMKTNIQLFFAC